MDSRPQLLARALELFASRGYDAVGVQEIVDAAGVTKPSLYHHFGSKRGLLRALLATQQEAQDAALAAAVAYRGDLSKTLRAVAAGYFRFSMANPVFSRLQLGLFFAPPESEGHQEVAAVNERAFTAVRELFLKATRDHGNMKGRHMLYAASFIGMINNCIGLALNGYLTLDENLVERSVHYFEHGIYS
jgi:TetR/AcrR family transcriptional regulator